MKLISTILQAAETVRSKRKVRKEAANTAKEDAEKARDKNEKRRRKWLLFLTYGFLLPSFASNGFPSRAYAQVSPTPVSAAVAPELTGNPHTHAGTEDAPDLVAILAAKGLHRCVRVDAVPVRPGEAFGVWVEGGTAVWCECPTDAEARRVPQGCAAQFPGFLAKESELGGLLDDNDALTERLTECAEALASDGYWYAWLGLGLVVGAAGYAGYEALR